MSNKEIKMWLSSDEINVSAEEDVFKIILAWIDYFVGLFRHVRLYTCASRDFLSSDLPKNDLVKNNERCLNRVMDAIKLIDSPTYGNNLSLSPRKSLETSVIVLTVSPDQSGQSILMHLSLETPTPGRRGAYVGIYKCLED